MSKNFSCHRHLSSHYSPFPNLCTGISRETTMQLMLPQIGEWGIRASQPPPPPYFFLGGNSPKTQGGTLKQAKGEIGGSTQKSALYVITGIEPLVCVWVVPGSPSVAPQGVDGPGLQPCTTQTQPVGSIP